MCVCVCGGGGFMCTCTYMQLMLFHLAGVADGQQNRERPGSSKVTEKTTCWP